MGSTLARWTDLVIVALDIKDVPLVDSNVVSTNSGWIQVDMIQRKKQYHGLDMNISSYLRGESLYGIS